MTWEVMKWKWLISGLGSFSILERLSLWFLIRRQSQISSLRVTRPALQNCQILSRTVGKFVGFFVAVMFFLCFSLTRKFSLAIFAVCVFTFYSAILKKCAIFMSKSQSLKVIIWNNIKHVRKSRTLKNPDKNFYRPVLRFGLWKLWRYWSWAQCG